MFYRNFLRHSNSSKINLLPWNHVPLNNAKKQQQQKNKGHPFTILLNTDFLLGSRRCQFISVHYENELGNTPQCLFKHGALAWRGSCRHIHKQSLMCRHLTVYYLLKPTSYDHNVIFGSQTLAWARTHHREHFTQLSLLTAALLHNNWIF